MIKDLLKPNENLPIGLDFIRMLSGGIIIYFGLEIFDDEQIQGYTAWLTDVNVPLPQTMAYVGKCTELICGSLLLLGLFTRLSTIPLIITMAVVTFVMLDGSLITQSFYLLLLFGVFLFLGSGKLSVDHLLHKKS